jgi:hypothetical protein
MIDSYDRQERIAIRMDSHISEKRAIELTDAEQSSIAGLQARIAVIESKQKSHHKKVEPIKHHYLPANEIYYKSLAAGDI